MKIHTCPECSHSHADHSEFGSKGRATAGACSFGWCGCLLTRRQVIVADPEGHVTSIPARPIPAGLP